MTEPRVDAFGRPVQPEAPTAPRWLYLARRLWMAGVLVNFAHSLIMLSDRAGLSEQLRQRLPELRQDQVDSTVSDSIMSSVLMSLLGLGLYLLLSTRVLQGRNWARIVLTVLGGLNALGTVLLLLLMGTIGLELINRVARTALTGWEAVFSVVVTLIEAAAIAAMFHPESNRYLREVRQLRGR
ncbi:hypothetical protein [Saccharopolyspora taberi]|uniref:Uncharacterized protein n=1 Tax=Saccharopolyspora taberi TaxID=60895 RepID=A0ABN3VMW5_9PSEU